MKNFFESACDLFYKFSNTQPGEVNFTFSREIIAPILTTGPELQITMPLPKKIEENYSIFGMLFDDSEKGQISMWSLFLAMLYHLAAHVAISDYSYYDVWRKNKTDELVWKVIDFIEDTRIKKYIMSMGGEIWNNVETIESILSNKQKTGKKQISKINPTFREVVNQRELELIKNQIFTSKENVGKTILSAADFLYKNSHLIKEKSIFCYEHKGSKFLIKIEEEGPLI
jgi:hypothetical protein